MLSTPFFGEPNLRNFMWQEVNCINFSPLLSLFMPNRFPFMCYIGVFPFCVSPFLANDIHVIGPLFVVPHNFKHFC
jgi:hypothetical protein